MKAQTPLMCAPFTNVLLLIDNGLTNNKQNTFETLIIHNMSTSCGVWPETTVKYTNYEIMTKWQGVSCNIHVVTFLCHMYNVWGHIYMI